MDRPATLSQPAQGGSPLPADDPALLDPELDLDRLAAHWAAYATRRPMSAEQMRGADIRAQRMGVPALALMEQAGAAVAAAVRATLRTHERPVAAPLLILAGSGNNGGDALVAARHLATDDRRCVVVLVGSSEQPGTAEARVNWQRLADVAGVERMHAARAREVAWLGGGLERVGLVVDGLLGTGLRGTLREPVSGAVELCLQARRLGVPVVAIDTPTALDLSSGVPSRPVVAANVTVTFHRPKVGLLAPSGRRYAGRVLVAPIGIPTLADAG